MKMISSYGWEKKNDIPSVTRAAYQSPGIALTRIIGRRMIRVVAVVLFVGIFVTVLNVYELRGMQDSRRDLHRESSVGVKQEKGIEDDPIQLVREKRDLHYQGEDQMENVDRKPTDNSAPRNNIGMADKGAVAVAAEDSLQETNEV
ncbi:uncharacterized protein LOC118430443 isoform X1 [Branchiostoma floridae]|uniref:Uncharacterized protein LOC118430443 isoform X1 n=1 Tax=Branchiostoma floridae TaxID=7739 RepID=A0A9J7NAJ2_BRAFL|nr:uncharacterized protein LOC118430443 isoform X1 [Branchiostoma floridae]